MNYTWIISWISGPVHTNADSKVYGFHQAEWLLFLWHLLPVNLRVLVRNNYSYLRVHTSTKVIRIRFYPLSRAFPNLYGFGGSDPRVSVDGRPKRIKKCTDSNESALVRTGPELSLICSFVHLIRSRFCQQCVFYRTLETNKTIKTGWDFIFPICGCQISH